jgi:hypothetical protein
MDFREQGVLQLVDRELSSMGFASTGERWWTRAGGRVLQQIHLSRSASGVYQVHAMIHAASERTEWTSLNGVSSAPGKAVRSLLGFDVKGFPVPPYRTYRFDVRKPGDEQRCASDVGAYVREVCLPWFSEWGSLEELMILSDSPLSNEERDEIKRQSWREMKSNLNHNPDGGGRTELRIDSVTSNWPEVLIIVLLLKASFGAKVELEFANIIDGGGVWNVEIWGHKLTLDQSSRGGAVTIYAKDPTGQSAVGKIAEAVARAIAGSRD